MGDAYMMELEVQRWELIQLEAVARYRRWRTAFYAERMRMLEGPVLALFADSDAEAAHILLTGGRDG